jgi:hypothetical protein
MNPQQYQVLIPTPGCSVGDILTANPDGTVTSTDGTVTYQTTSLNFATNFGLYDPTTNWTPLVGQTVWTFSFNLSAPPAITVVSRVWDGSTDLQVLLDSGYVFPDQASATSAIPAAATFTNTQAVSTMTASKAMTP